MNIYKFWKSEKKQCTPLQVDVFYRSASNDEWTMQYKDSNNDVLTCKNVEGAFLAYFREASAKNVGEGDIIMYVNENGNIEIDPNDSVFNDIREKMSDSLYSIVCDYAGNNEKRMGKVRVKNQSIDR